MCEICRHFGFASQLLSVNPLAGWPTCDGDRQVLYSRRAVFITIDQRVRQEFLVIPLGKVRALVCPTGFRPMQSALDDRFGHVEHEGEFQCSGQFGIECVAMVFDSDIAEPSLQLLYLSCCCDK